MRRPSCGCDRRREQVTAGTHRLDDLGTVRIALELASQPAHQDVDAALEGARAAALGEIEQLIAQRQQAEKVRADAGLDDAEFEVYWAIRNELPADAVTLAQQVVPIVRRFPAAASSTDEYRRLKAELYRLILHFADGQRMLRLTDAILSATLRA